MEPHYTNKAFPKWRCSEGSGGGGCSRGKKSARYQSRAIDGETAVRLASWRRCTDIVLKISDDNRQPTYGLVHQRTSCKVAQRVARAAISDASESTGPFAGFRCKAGNFYVTCTQGSKKVRWQKFSENPANG